MKTVVNLLILIWISTSLSQNPPNIVIFIADDLGAIDLPLYGNPTVKTPHINDLATESLVFLNAFAASPTCSPSRAAILTGMMPFKNGAHENHAGIKEGIKTLPLYLKQFGYRSAIAGKYHIGPAESYPFEMIHGSNAPEPGHEGQGVLWTDLIIEPVDKWLNEVGKESTPFLLVVNDHSPHVFWPENPEYVQDSIDIPNIHIDTKETRNARAKYYTDITKMDNNLGKLVSSLKRHNSFENTVIIFTSDQGPQWAFGKWSLYDYGIKVPLIIKWPSVIKGSSVTNAMVSLVDLTPTIYEIAGGHASQLDKDIDGLSLLPLIKGEISTHRDLVFATHTGDGKMNPTPIRMVRTDKYKYILNLAPDTKYTTHMDKANRKDEGGEYWSSWIKHSFTDEHAASVLYRYHNHPREELYDVSEDPSERINLAFNDEYGTILDSLRQKLSEWRAIQNDYEDGPYSPTPKNVKGIPYIFD